METAAGKHHHHHHHHHRHSKGKKKKRRHTTVGVGVLPTVAEKNNEHRKHKHHHHRRKRHTVTATNSASLAAFVADHAEGEEADHRKHRGKRQHHKLRSQISRRHARRDSLAERLEAFKKRAQSMAQLLPSTVAETAAAAAARSSSGVRPPHMGAAGKLRHAVQRLLVVNRVTHPRAKGPATRAHAVQRVTAATDQAIAPDYLVEAVRKSAVATANDAAWTHHNFSGAQSQMALLDGAGNMRSPSSAVVKPLHMGKGKMRNAVQRLLVVNRMRHAGERRKSIVEVQAAAGRLSQKARQRRETKKQLLTAKELAELARLKREAEEEARRLQKEAEEEARRKEKEALEMWRRRKTTMEIFDVNVGRTLKGGGILAKMKELYGDGMTLQTHTNLASNQYNDDDDSSAADDEDQDDEPAQQRRLSVSMRTVSKIKLDAEHDKEKLMESMAREKERQRKHARERLRRRSTKKELLGSGQLEALQALQAKTLAERERLERMEDGDGGSSTSRRMSVSDRTLDEIKAQGRRDAEGLALAMQSERERQKEHTQAKLRERRESRKNLLSAAQQEQLVAASAAGSGGGGRPSLELAM